MKRIVILILIFLAILGLYFINKYQVKDDKMQIASYKNISPQDLDKMVKSSNIFLVDVHIPQQNHLPNTDLFVPFNKIKENIDKFPKDKNAQIVVYCRSGNMSIEASEELAKSGYKNVNNLIGGINAYRESHYGIFINPDTRNLGIVTYGDVAKTTFELTNNTKETVKITKVTTSCGCTKAFAEKEELKPDETTKINVSFDPAVHKDDTDLGDITRIIFIETNHTSFNKLQTTISAKVIKK